MKKSLLLSLAFVGIMGAQASLIFQEDFESLPTGQTGLQAPTWTWGVVNYTSNMVPTGGFFFPGTSPGNIYAIETGQAGPGQGDQTLRAYADYGFAPNFANDQFLETVLYSEHTITAEEAALGTATFSFDYKNIDLADPSSGFVYLKVVNSSDFSTIDYVTAEITSMDWSSGLLQTDISLQEGNLLQYGTSVFSQNYSPTGVAVDNFQVEAIPEPTTIAFFGIFGGAMLFMRRRMRK